MSLSLLLSVCFALAVLCFAWALAVPPIAELARLRRQRLARLAGDGAQPSHADVRLRQTEPGFRPSEVFRGIAPESMAAFGTELKRVGIALAAFLSLVLTLLLRPFHESAWIWGMALGTVLAIGLSWLWLRMRVARRLRAIGDTVPEALEMIVRSLRVGLPIGSAIQTAGRDLVGPLAGEFLKTADRISYGQDVSEALRDMAIRCRNQDLQFFASAVAIQMATGGNLAEVLERLAEISRGRLQFRRKVASITSEARWSGRFLSAFPLVASGGLMIINPSYFETVVDKPWFIPMLVLVGALLVLNIVFMRLLLRIE